MQHPTACVLVYLSDAVTGLDRRNLGLVLAALSHANGSHDFGEAMRSTPARVRSWMSSRSKLARAPKTWNTNRPPGVMVSMFSCTAPMVRVKYRTARDGGEGVVQAAMLGWVVGAGGASGWWCSMTRQRWRAR